MRFPHDGAYTARGLEVGRPVVTIGDLVSELGEYLALHPRCRFPDDGGIALFRTTRVWWSETRTERIGDSVRTFSEDVTAECAMFGFSGDAPLLARGRTPAELLLGLRALDPETLLREPVRVVEVLVPTGPGVERVAVEIAPDLDRCGLGAALLRERLDAGGARRGAA